MSDDKHRRPAEAQLPTLVGDLRQSLLGGFETRHAVIEWLQEIAITTIGEIDTNRFADFGYEFRPDSEYMEGVVLAAFLRKPARTRDMTDQVARRARRQWAANVITPASSDAMRRLRNDAAEYSGTDDDSGGERIDHRITFQRPALEELHSHQQQVLTRLLDGGLDDRADILDWGDDLLLATRGEPVQDGREPGDLVRDLHNDPSGDLIMCSTEQKWVYHRQVWVTRQLLPSFNRAVRDLYGKSTEEPGEQKTAQTDYRNV